MIENWIDQGGPIIRILFALNIIGWSIMLWKSISLILFKINKNHHCQRFENYYNFGEKKHNQENDEGRLDSALSNFIHPYRSGMNTIRIIATISPLLGLLGTVLGILNSFSVIAKSGLDNPTLFAEGISMALITTAAGITIAIPHLIGYNYLSGTLQNFERILESSFLKLGAVK